MDELLLESGDVVLQEIADSLLLEDGDGDGGGPVVGVGPLVGAGRLLNGGGLIG